MKTDKYGANVIIEWIHYLCHAGRMFTLSSLKTGIASAGTHIVSFTTPSDKEVHVVVEVSANVTGSVALKEGATVTGGTSLTPVCNNRTENKAASSTAKFDPTVTVAGTQLFSVQLPTGGATKKVLSLVRDEGEIVLRRATTYTITYTAGDGSAACSIAIEFYEA